MLARRVRCGECIQVCITNGLQPTTLQAGLEGLFTSYLLTRRGICETKFPLPGRSTVYVTNAAEVRDPENTLPGAAFESGGGYS